MNTATNLLLRCYTSIYKIKNNFYRERFTTETNENLTNNIEIESEIVVTLGNIILL